MVEHHTLLYADLRDPVALLRGERRWDRARPLLGLCRRPARRPLLAGEQVADYSALMSASQPLVAGDILDAYPLDRHRCLLDVGGGEGAFLAAAAATHARPAPDAVRSAAGGRAGAGTPRRGRARRASDGVRGRLQRRPAAAGCGCRLAGAGRPRSRRRGGAWASACALRRALPADGVLLLAEPMSGTAGAEPIGDAYFGFYLLAMGSGRPRTPERAAHHARQRRLQPRPAGRRRAGRCSPASSWPGPEMPVEQVLVFLDNLKQ